VSFFELIETSSSWVGNLAAVRVRPSMRRLTD